MIPFDRVFDGTNMTVEQIRETAREKNWPGIHIDMIEFKKTGKVMVYRMSRRECDGYPF